MFPVHCPLPLLPNHELRPLIALCQECRGQRESGSPTYAAHNAHDPPAGVIAHFRRLHDRLSEPYGPLAGTSVVFLRSVACSSWSI